ncbi:acetyltransferase [Achromobacter sp. EB05]|uniref:acetyltransferase n=1 Tax=Achromobacter sp. EB05 TaxID=3142974 RepID=UPI003783C5D9
MKPIVIFGTGDIAELAHFYFSEDAQRQVVAFTVDREYLGDGRFCGRPVIAFDEITRAYPPDSYEMFIALSYSGLNQLRKAKFLAAQGLGYTLASYVSSRCTYLSKQPPGQNCFILEDNTIQPFVVIGDNVTLWSGNHIGHHSSVGSHCFLASHVVVSGGVNIGERCFIGVNATLRDHITIGENCVIGAAVTLLADAAPEGVYAAATVERSRVPSSRLKRI